MFGVENNISWMFRKECKEEAARENICAKKFNFDRSCDREATC